MAYEFVDVLTHSAIRIAGNKTLYFDPYDLQVEPHDADVVFVTHEHYDHYSPTDLAKVATDATTVVVPQGMVEQVQDAFPRNKVVGVVPGQRFEVCGVAAEAVASYNVGKPFHPRENSWVGYLVDVREKRCFITGDCDAEPENLAVSCDLLLVPIGGTYTFSPLEAADYTNTIRPAAVIPTHYGTVVGTYADAETFAAAVDPAITVETRLP